MNIIEAGPRSSPELNSAIGDFVSYEIWGEPGRVENFCSLGVFNSEKLIAGVLYHNHYPDAGVIEMTAAAVSKLWLTRPVLKAMFSLPFDRFGCQLCVLRISETNHNMLRIAQKFGFEAYRIPRLRGRGEDEIICTLTDDRWRGHRIHKAH